MTTEAIYMLYVPKAHRLHVRTMLKEQTSDAVTWKERMSLSGSEFSIHGPAALARETHEGLANWLARIDANHP